MKLWIRNILQKIINKIESEEDKTLPEDYFNEFKKSYYETLDSKR